MGLMMETQDIQIITDRLIIRRPVLEEAQEINAAMNEVWHDLQLWMSWAYDDQRSLDATRSYIAQADARGFLPLAGYCRSSGQFVVSTGITFHADGRRETGYWVAKPFLGQGYATEAAQATLRYGFETLGIQNFFINHFEGNHASQRIIEKLGFRKTGVLEKEHARCLDGALLDEHQYEMTADEWRQRCL